MNKCTTCLCFIFNPTIKDKVVEFFNAITNDINVINNMIESGKNQEYNVNINNMIRRTISDYLGHEEEIKKFLKDNKLEGFLEIVPEIHQSDIKPVLSLEDDIIEFLYKSGIRMDLDYYIY